MHPTIFTLPWGTPVNAYGTLILLGGLAAMPGVFWDIKARGMAKGRAGSMLVDLYLVLIFGAAIGGRVLDVLTMPSKYTEDPARIVALDGTGFVFFGSLLAIVGGIVWLSRRYEAPLTGVLDLCATWMPLGHLFGRLGCFFAGCCHGAPSEVGWAVSFPPDSVAYAAGEVATHAHGTVPLHPVQLYETLGLLSLWLVLVTIRRTRGIERPTRQAARYAIGYGALRIVTEVFRGDPSRGALVTITWPGLAEALALPADQTILLSSSQAVGMMLIGVGIWAWRRSMRPGAP